VVDVSTSICILEFVWISLYGTYSELLDWRNQAQYIVDLAFIFLFSISIGLSDLFHYYSFDIDQFFSIILPYKKASSRKNP